MISLKHFVISTAIMFALVLYFQGNTTLSGEFGQNLELANGALSNNDQNSTAENTTGVSNNFHEKGNALLDAGKYENAISYYDKAVSIDPSNIDALYNKSFTLEFLGKHEDAKTYFDKVLTVNRNDTTALNTKGLALIQLDKVEEAIAYYDKTLAMDPSNIDALYNKAYAL